MEKLMKAIEEFTKRHDGEVCLLGSFFTFDKKGDVKDDNMIAYGSVEQMNIQIDAFREAIDNEVKNLFINRSG